MIEIKYYKRTNGDVPARDWINAQDRRIRPNIYRKLEDLSREGLILLHTNSLAVIKGPDTGLYELRNRGLGWRIALYYDKEDENFILLHGWKKDKNYEREIEKARMLLNELKNGDR